MAVSITNRTDERVLLRFNSGSTRYLGPREVLSDVEHVEVKGNARIHSLGERRIISIRSDADAAGARRARAKPAGPPAGEAEESGGGEGREEEGEPRAARGLKKLRRPRKEG